MSQIEQVLKRCDIVSNSSITSLTWLCDTRNELGMLPVSVENRTRPGKEARTSRRLFMGAD